MKYTVALAICLGLGLPTIPVLAHEAAEARHRVILAEAEGGDTVLHIRLPAPLLFMAELSARDTPGDRVPAPFLSAEWVLWGWLHRLDAAAIAADPGGFADRLVEAVSVRIDGRPIRPVVQAFALHGDRGRPPFASRAEARAAVSAGVGDVPGPFVGTAVVDARLRVTGQGTISVASAVGDESVPHDVFIETDVVDYRVAPPYTLHRHGALDKPVILPLLR